MLEDTLRYYKVCIQISLKSTINKLINLHIVYIIIYILASHLIFHVKNPEILIPSHNAQILISASLFENDAQFSLTSCVLRHYSFLHKKNSNFITYFKIFLPRKQCGELCGEI